VTHIAWVGFLQLNVKVGVNLIVLAFAFGSVKLFLPRVAMHKCGLCRHAVSVCVPVCHVREFCQNE